MLDVGKNQGWKMWRCFYLIDEGWRPTWTARVCFHANKIEDLAATTIDDLNMDTLVAVWVKNQKDQNVYHWDKVHKHEQNYNTAYPGMPMKGKGLWPWPDDKPEAGQGEG